MRNVQAEYRCEGLIHIYVIALVRAITVTIAKNGMDEITRI